jgi:hypothetical protein
MTRLSSLLTFAPANSVECGWGLLGGHVKTLTRETSPPVALLKLFLLLDLSALVDLL